MLVTDSGGGTVIAQNTYDEYGIPSATNSGRFQYTGQSYLPDLGMYYYKARIYSPTLGRHSAAMPPAWHARVVLQTDPIGYRDQINLYAYVGNDPINKSDPTEEATACDGKPCPTLQGANPTATKVANAVNSAIRSQNSTSTVPMKGATVSVQAGTHANTTVSVKTPVGSVTMSGTAQPSTTKSSVTIGGLRVSSTIGSVTSTPSSVTVFHAKGGKLRYHIGKYLVISKNILVTKINVANIGAGAHVIK